ncbi:protein of unknown function [Candidatus Filomicrobium marinum]|nr:protein of unknown function [Candidatus Filomicrobium marinum]
MFKINALQEIDGVPRTMKRRTTCTLFPSRTLQNSGDNTRGGRNIAAGIDEGIPTGAAASPLEFLNSLYGWFSERVCVHIRSF